MGIRERITKQKNLTLVKVGSQYENQRCIREEVRVYKEKG